MELAICNVLQHSAVTVDAMAQIFEANPDTIDIYANPVIDQNDGRSDGIRRIDQENYRLRDRQGNLTQGECQVAGMFETDPIRVDNLGEFINDIVTGKKPSDDVSYVNGNTLAYGFHVHPSTTVVGTVLESKVANKDILLEALDAVGNADRSDATIDSVMAEINNSPVPFMAELKAGKLYVYRMEDSREPITSKAIVNGDYIINEEAYERQGNTLLGPETGGTVTADKASLPIDAMVAKLQILQNEAESAGDDDTKDQIGELIGFLEDDTVTLDIIKDVKDYIYQTDDPELAPLYDALNQDLINTACRNTITLK